MAPTFYMRFLLVGEEEDLIFEVRKGESERLRKKLADRDPEGFFWFDGIDGRSIIVNLAYLQGVRFLWDMVPAPPNERLNPEEELQIKFRGKKVLSEYPSEHASEVYSLFSTLEMGEPEVIAYEDVDGEMFHIVPAEVVWITASKRVLDEGSREIRAEDGDADLEPIASLSRKPAKKKGGQ